MSNEIQTGQKRAEITTTTKKKSINFSLCFDSNPRFIHTGHWTMALLRVNELTGALRFFK